MATLSATSATTKPSNSSILVDSLPFIDMKTLSQSELHSLSFLSSSHLRRSVADSVVSPSIDRSSFNESVGSRRQTYSRPSPHHHHHHRHRLAANLPKSSVSAVDHPSNPSFEDPDRVENRSIIKCLKQLLSSHPDFEQPHFVELDFFNSNLNFHPLPEVTVVEGEFPVVGRKRKRGRRPKVKALAGFEKDREMGMVVVNKNGNVVDLIALGKLEDPYREELKRRTQGLQKEEELFGFFRELNGQWCSRRRKRKIVDANEFGDALPTGWKLLLGLKRKEGRAWVYCRRYISPGGQQFVSCKDVSEYLESMPRTYSQGIDVGADVQLDHGMNIVKSHGGIAEMEHNLGQLKENKNEIEIDDLAEIQIRDLFKCHVCNRSFNERGSYLQHLSSLHQKASRHESDSPGDGVIIKDGNYECQFCHEVFEERLSYDGHLEVHVKNCIGGTGESPHEGMGLPQKIDSSEDELPSGISKMDALIEIAQNSVRESPSRASDHGRKSNSALGEPEVEDLQNHISTELCYQKNADDVIIDGKIEKNGETIHDEAVNILSSSVQVKDEGDYATSSPGSSNSQKAICNTDNILGTGTGDHPNPAVIDNVQTFEVDIDFGDIACMRDMIGQQKTEQQYLEEHEPCNTIPETPTSLLQLPMPKTTLDEQENVCNSTNARNGKTGFEELSIEDIDQLRYSYGSGEEPVFLYDMEIDIENNENTNTTKCFSELFGSDGIDIADRQQLTTVCIWCGVEFIDEALDTDVQSESVGYMCPACKAKTSGQIDMMDAGCL